jgi:hypothetical protein
MADKTEREKKRRAQNGRYALMGAVILISTLGIVGSHLIDAKFWKEFIGHIGTAGIIAGLLGLTIDYWMRKQIVDDVFEAAFGYALPDDIKEEMRAVYSNNVICESHEHLIELEQIDDDLVRVTMSIERTLKNLGNVTQELPIKLGTDDFSFRLPSEVLDFKYRFGSGNFIDCLSLCKKRRRGRFIEAKAVKLPSEATITFLQKFTEIHRANDLTFIQFSRATRNPRLRVAVPDDYEYEIGFSHRTPPVKSHYSGAHELPGIMLPHQSIQFRWWRREQAERWLGT